MVITAPTPMMTPSIVKALRSLLTRSVRMAIRALSQTFTRPPPPRAVPARPWRRAARESARRRGGGHRERQHPARKGGDIWLVRDKHNREALAVELLQED